MAKDALTPRQAKFASEYLVDLNGKQAAIRAGYSKGGAEVTASKLLRVPKVAAVVQGAMTAQAERVGVTADDVLRELKHIAFLNLSGAYDAKGNLLPVKDIPEAIVRAISGIKVFDEFEGSGKQRRKVGEVRELKFTDKLRALELLGKHIGLWNEKSPFPAQPSPAVTVNVNTQVNHAPSPQHALEVLHVLTAAGALPITARSPDSDDDAEADEVRRPTANGAAGRLPARRRP